MHNPVDRLYERLLRDGIAPAVAARYTGELRDHLEDLGSELETLGLSPDDAAAEALRRLGELEALALPMLVDPRLRSWASRAPALVYLAVPVVAQLAIVAAAAAALVFAARSAGALPAWFGPAATASTAMVALAPVTIAWSMIAHAVRRRSRIFWPALGTLATILAGAALQLTILPPGDGARGGLSLAVTMPDLSVLAPYALVTLFPLVLLSQPRTLT